MSWIFTRNIQETLCFGYGMFFAHIVENMHQITTWWKHFATSFKHDYALHIELSMQT